MLAEVVSELSPSAQRAVQRYVSALHFVENLVVPGRSGERVNAAPDPKRVPGNLDAAGAHRKILRASEQAEEVRRLAHKQIVGLAYRSSTTADLTARRTLGEAPAHDGCTVVEDGVQCGLPVHGRALCAKHYRRQQRAGTRNTRRTSTHAV